MPFMRSLTGGLSPVRGPEASRTPAATIATRRLAGVGHRRRLPWRAAPQHPVARAGGAATGKRAASGSPAATAGDEGHEHGTEAATAFRRGRLPGRRGWPSRSG
jgi:hypothetical protein